MPIPQTPPTSWRVVLPVLSRACCSFPVACTEPLAARRCWVRPALSEEFAFSSYLWKGLYDLRGASPGWSPRVPALTSAFCAQRLLSRLPRPAPPRSEYEEGSRGTGLCRPAAVRSLWGRLGFWWQVAGEGPCTRPRARYPPSPRGVVAGPVGLEGRRWAPGPTRLPVSPVPSVACASLPCASTSRPLSRRGRVACGACRVLSGVCGCRLVPPFHGSVPTAGGDRGSPPTPPSPSAGLSRVREPRGLASLSGGGLLIWGNRRPAASGASSDVGTRCHAGVFVGWRRRLPRFSLASAGVSSGSRGCPLVSGRLGAAGVAGLLRVGCSVIPAGLARVPGRRPSGLPVPCEASPAGGVPLRPALPSTVLVLPVRSPLPARWRSRLSRSSSGRPAAVLPGPSSRWGSRARTGPGAVAGCLGEGPPGGREEVAV